MSRPQFHISINALRHSSQGWGDLAYAEALAEAFRRQGCGAQLFFRDESPQLSGQDVVLRIIGPHLEEPVEGVANLLWIISPPNLAPLATLARYQRVFLASELLCQRLSGSGLTAEYLPQATDTGLFHPGAAPEGDEEFPLVFVGNQARRAPRQLILKAIALGFRPALWGQGWEGLVPAGLIRGSRVSSDELAGIYARARVVLNSHMPHMSSLGYMSNRSFDALSCGARVISDQVAGFADPDLPWLHQTGSDEDLSRLLTGALDAGPDPAPIRAARHQAVAAAYSFDARASRFIDAAAALLASGAVAPGPLPQAVTALLPHAAPAASAAFTETSASAAFTGTPASAAHTETPASAALSDDPALALPGDIALEDALAAAEKLHLRLRLSDPGRYALAGGWDFAPRAGETAGNSDIDLTGPAMLSAARAILRLTALAAAKSRFASLSPEPAPDGTPSLPAPIHALQQDLRQAQGLVLTEAPDPELALDLARRARRLLDAVSDPGSPGALPGTRLLRAQDSASLIRVARAAPLHEHSPAGYDRNRQKRHLLLWPRHQVPRLNRPVGVFLHLYYDDLAPEFQAALARLKVPAQLYISTDSAAKAARIAPLFPQAGIRVLPNRGRDIWPKLCGFPGAHDRHDLVLHLHGKRSAGAAQLAGWLDHILACLLPEAPLLNRLISLFDASPRLGIVVPQAFRPALASGHWADNHAIARELAWRMQLPAPLPGDDALDFPAGSMFWARPAAIAPLTRLALPADAFPPERRQIDGTPAHAIERLYGVVCQQQGYELVPVAPPGPTDWAAHQIRLSRNGELKELLERGRFQELTL